VTIALFSSRPGQAVIPTGGLLSLTIVDSTIIDPISSIGIDGNGWVAILVLKGLTSLVGTCLPAQFSMVVSDPGYDTSGNVTTVSRTITGVAQLRRQYPNGASMNISTDGTDLTIYITLDDWIYSGTTIVSYSMGATFYTGAAASTSGATKTNSSSLAYIKPLFSWINPQQDRATASTFNVEAVAFHRHAQSGTQVACIKFNVNDGTTTSSDQTVSAVALSALQTIGNIPEVWNVAGDFSGMAPGQPCHGKAKVRRGLGY